MAGSIEMYGQAHGAKVAVLESYKLSATIFERGFVVTHGLWQCESGGMSNAGVLW
jgi:hypothetical protein